VEDLAYLAAPLFLLSILIEVALLRRERARGARGLRGYFGPDTAASLAMGVGNVVISFALRGATLGLYFFLYAHRVFEIGTGALAFVALFFAEDLTYYVWHRASHEVRFLWAAHENHHSSERFNLSTALRQSWTTPLTVPLAYWWLPLAGFHPLMILTQVSLSLIYQFWIHTELVDRMPRWFEAVFNTPSHHRVHHASNVRYLDRNHAGILIVWDRLFGSFEPEDREREPVRYGLTKNLESFDPLRIAFHEWAAMLGGVLRARTWRERLGYLFAPPGWSPDGSSLTASQLRLRVTAACRTG
jgi:sterol desaturase/sphingolipid hydroxylase (fatty acid hydroxylase superfamily)